MSYLPLRAILIGVVATAGSAVAPLLAQQLPLDLESSAPMDELTFQVYADKPEYSVAVEECPDSDSQCVVIRNRGASVSLTYELDAAPLQGKRVRFSASLLVDFPAISRAQLFVRVDRPAGVGFHEYSPSRRDEMPEWTNREIIGTVDSDAKRITVGLRLSGRGTAYFAKPAFETVSD